MNKYQTARHASNQLFVKEAESNPASMNLILRFAQAVARLKSINASVDAIAIEQLKEISGATTEKSNSKVELIDWTIDVAGAVHSYAGFKNDVNLMAQSDFNVSDIEQANHSDLLNNARLVLQLAKSVPDKELRNEGILPENLAAFEHAISHFADIKSAPREASIDRSSHTEHLSQLFSESNDLLKGTIDKLLPQYRRKDAVYYAKLKTARVLPISTSRKKGDDSTDEKPETK